MAEIRHVKNREIAISHRNKLTSDFDDIWYTNADLELGNSHVIKIESFFKIEVADDRHFKNRFWP